ncbi:MAG: LCP family protein [Parcubacteria group bacterium]|jgi:LCP family protein required for cell wall assembly
MDAIYYNSPKKSRRIFSGKRILGIFFLLFLLGGFTYGGFFAWKIYAVGKKISIENNNQPSFLETFKSLATENPIDIRSIDPDRINILLLGIAGKGKPGQFLTDTMMIMSIDRKTNRVAFLSIPRDLFVTIPKANFSSKINGVYQFGLNRQDDPDSSAKIDPLMSVIKNITGLDMDYYAVLNFDGFRQAIDDIGGVNIVSERDLFDARYPGPNYSYETFELKKGFHTLDGATALKYARERHNDPQGDFGRAKRQQQIMQATKNKIFSASTLFNPIALNNLLNTLGDNLVTNITSAEIGNFLELAKKLDTQNITNVVLDAWNKDSLLKIVHIGPASVLIPRAGNYSEVQDLAQNIFDLNVLQRKREEIAKEDATIAIINRSGVSQITAKIQKLLRENLDYKNVTVIHSSGKDLAEQSTVFDLTNGTKPFTANELVTKLPATIAYSKNVPALNTEQAAKFDIIVVIGKDLTPQYNMEEGTLEDLNKSRDDQESADFNKN